MTELTLERGSKEWHQLRHKAQNDLYWLNEKILGHDDVMPAGMSYRAHYGMCRFAERKTGIPLIDDSRAQLIQVCRGIGKSLLITKGRSIQRLLQDRNYAVGIANENQRNAERFLGQIKAEFENNELLQFLFPEHIPDFKKTTWSASEIIINRERGHENPVNPSVLATGVGATVTGRHMDEWIVDDMLSEDLVENALSGTFTEIEKLNRWVIRLPPLLKHPTRGRLCWVGCIGHDEPILMADGTWKPIQNVEVGDEVWAAKKDGSEGYKARKVTGVWPQGYSDVVEIDVAGRQVVCTPDHPFGTPQGVKKAEEFARENGRKERGVLINCYEGKPNNEEVDYDHDWLAGFMWGDGWVTKHERPDGLVNYSVSFALGEHEALNRRAERLLNKYYGESNGMSYDSLRIGGLCYKASKRVMRMDNNEAGRRWERLGLTPGVRAPHKTIPDWVFKAPLKARRAFLHGLCSADGHKKTRRCWRFSTASKEMAEQIHRLAMMSFVRPSAIYDNSKVRQAPNSPKPTWSSLYQFNLNFLDRREEVWKYGVKSVKPLETQRPVYDLTVEDGDCCYVVNGLADSQNTPWYDGDSYDFVEDTFGRGEEPREIMWNLEFPDGNSQTIKLIQKGELAIFRLPIMDESGNSIFPEFLSNEELEETRRKDPEFFAAQYLLRPGKGGDADFRTEWLHEFQWENPYQIRFRTDDGRTKYLRTHDMNILMSVDPAISKRDEAANSAIAVVGTDGERLFQLESWTGKVSATDLAHKVIEFHQRYQPLRIMVEAVAYQEALIEVLNLVKREYNIQHLPIYEFKPGTKIKKNVRIRGLEPFFSRGLFYYDPRTQQQFYEEYSKFPQMRLKDTLDALSFQKDRWEVLFAQESGGGSRMEEWQEQSRRAAQRVREHASRRRRYG